MIRRDVNTHLNVTLECVIRHSHYNVLDIEFICIQEGNWAGMDHLESKNVSFRYYLFISRISGKMMIYDFILSEYRGRMKVVDRVVCGQKPFVVQRKKTAASRT